MNSGIARATLLGLPLFLLLCTVALWNPDTRFWGGVESPKAQVEAYDDAKLKSAQALDSSIYDQAKLHRLLREPQNTVSNLAFAAVGFAIGCACRRQLSKNFAAACV